MHYLILTFFIYNVKIRILYSLKINRQKQSYYNIVCITPNVNSYPVENIRYVVMIPIISTNQHWMNVNMFTTSC